MTGSDRLRILIVGNESLAGCDTAASLNDLGHCVVGTCRSSEEAIRLCGEVRPGLVLMDVDLNGPTASIETAKCLQRHGPAAVVYLSTRADHLEAIKRAGETHPQCFLHKPFSKDELRLALETATAQMTEEMSRRSLEHRYFETLESLADGVISADLAGIIAFMNPAAAHITGWAQDHVVGRSLHEVFRIFHASGEPAMVEFATPAHPVSERTVWLTTRDGTRIPVQDRSTPLRDRTGQLTGVTVLFRILPTEAARETPVPPPAPAAAQTPLADVVESISDPLIALDGHWRLIYANTSAQQLFGRDAEKLLGIDLWDLLPAATRSTYYEAFSQAMQRREAVNREVFLEEKHIWLELRGYPFAEGLLILCQDITSKREEEERKHRLDRLESLGLLARGFAHEFNNLLTVLLGNLSLAEMRARTAIQLPELHAAKQATLLAQGLVQQLLTFARGGAPVKRPSQLGEIVEQFFQHHSRAADIDYRLEVLPRLPSLAVDPAQIRRLLGNLVRNAEQAQSGGGVITVRCHAPDADEMFAHDVTKDQSDQPTGVVIEVHDGGAGILAEHLPHIFEPYFSTRKAENATGLGLTVCESIAKAHGGSLSVRSESGKGTSVRFYLPVDADGDEADALGISRAYDGPMQAASQRILVLEDDPLVRSLIVRNLGSQGYEITETAEGSETVRMYQESLQAGRRFDLVILDLSIPNGMGGVRTMEKLCLLDSEVTAIVSSGYSDDPVMAKPAAYGFAAVLPKPYEPADMLRLVKNVISQRSVRNG